jgi:hypothetical protein
MKIKVIKKGSQQAATVETVRQQIFDKEAERQAAETIKTWIYATRSRKLAEEQQCREFWKLH